MLLTIVVFVVILSILVLVHELGHFFVAKRNGVVSEEFGLGYPPRIAGIFRDKNNRKKMVLGSREIKKEDKKDDDTTVYSLNWIPFGGFVKIRGEDGEDKKDKKSFASKSIWVRFKILFAGVTMNFLLGIVLLAFALQIGLPEAIDDGVDAPGAKIQIAQVLPGSPAEELGVKLGDQVISVVGGGETVDINSVEQLQKEIADNAGKEMTFNLKQGKSDEIVSFTSVLRSEVPEGEGILGVVLVRTTPVKYGFFESFWIATKVTLSLIGAIVMFLVGLIAKLFTSQPVTADVTGPIGIAVLTGQVARLGIAHVLQFAAILSINLAVINLFPFPALDGGRILFLLIEKIKGSPISKKAEGVANSVGFAFLIILMIFVTVRDFMNFKIVDKVKDLF
jgi:regulator of sigma E protease